MFRGYVERMLVLTLQPSDVVVVDNLSSHKTRGDQEAIEAVGARFATCRPIRQTSIPSSPWGRWSSNTCAPPPHAPRISWCMLSETPCVRSPLMTATDSSPDADIPEHKKEDWSSSFR